MLWWTTTESTRAREDRSEATTANEASTPAGREARPASKRAPAHEVPQPASPYVEIEDLAGRLEYTLARHGGRFGVDEWLAAARVVEGLRHCIGGWVRTMSREEWRQQPNDTLGAGLNRVANELRTLAEQFGMPIKGQGRYPSDTTRIYEGARALRDGAAEHIKAGKVAPSELALVVDGLRRAFVDVGSLQVLPYNGTFDERIATFTAAIGRLRENSEGGNLDAQAVVTACARACGNKRGLFDAERKRQKR